MFSLPQLPDWNALHVLVIHFPLALLMLAAPVLILLALAVPKASRHFAAAAAVMLVLGTGFCYLAESTGGAAGDLARAQGALEDSEIRDTLNRHGEWAFRITRMFTGFTAVFLVYLLIALTRQEPLPALGNGIILAVMLVINAVLALGLGNAAHLGGELVHTHGLMAPLEPGAGRAAAEAALGWDDYDAYPEHGAHDSADNPDDGEAADEGE